VVSNNKTKLATAWDDGNKIYKIDTDLCDYVLEKTIKTGLKIIVSHSHQMASISFMDEGMNRNFTKLKVETA
jgi:hypothetical protein